MSQRATYGCTALMMTNKAGIIKPDADGYYELILGGLDVFNSAGAFYPLAPAKQLFEDSSQLQRRIRGGNLRGEYGHPKFLPGMSARDFIARIMEIREENISHHIREVTIVHDVKDKDGRPTVAVIGKVKPSGPKGEALGDSLENRHENVCFSIRSLTHDETVNGRHVKNIRNIVTWDFVNEPGIAIATKYNAPTLESLQEFSFNVEQFRSARDHVKGLGMESALIIDAREIEDAFGWARGKISAPPPSQRW